MEPIISIPDWVKHAIFYQIFPDRFALSQSVAKPNNLEVWDSKPTVHGFKGGDLLGVVEKMDYLREKSPYLDWFDIHGFPLNAYGSNKSNPNYRSWAGLPALPEFNTENPQVRNFIFNAARYWLEKGIDCWRLDVPYEINDDDFWRQFRSTVKSINPQAYIVGEIPWEAQHWCQGDQFDGVMNYQFTQACLAIFGGEDINRDLEQGFMGLPSTPIFNAQEFSNRVDELLNLYPTDIGYSQLNLLSFPLDGKRWDNQLYHHYKSCIQLRREPLQGYMQSMGSISQWWDHQTITLAQDFIRSVIAEDDSFHITKSQGMVIGKLG